VFCATNEFFGMQLQVWRINGLIRLYVGFLLFTLSDSMNPVKRAFTFDQWYMFYFHDMQLWEKKKMGGEGSPSTVFTNLSFTGNRIVRNSLGSTLSSSLDDADSQVMEVASRVIDVAKVCSLN